MMLKLVRKSRFKKDFKKLFSSGKDLDKLASVIRALQAQETLPERNRDHALTGNYNNHRECHISPDWLLIYQTTETELTSCALARTAICSDDLAILLHQRDFLVGQFVEFVNQAVDLSAASCVARRAKHGSVAVPR